MALTRRAFTAATVAGVVAPTITRAKECPAAGMDWMTMSLEARNLAYFNVAHVGADFARQKTESWTAASKDLCARQPKQQRGSKEIFACLAEGALANGWPAALPGYTPSP
jgi:arylformamidase